MFLDTAPGVGVSSCAIGEATNTSLFSDILGAMGLFPPWRMATSSGDQSVARTPFDSKYNRHTCTDEIEQLEVRISTSLRIIF